MTDEEAKKLRRTAELNCAGVKDTCRMVIAALDDRQRYRAALKRLTSPSWHTNIETDMLAADDVDGVYAAAHATIDEVQAIAREALKEAK